MLEKVRRLVAVLALIAPFALSSGARAGASADLNALFEEYWAFEMREDPFRATFNGVNDYNDAVPARAPADFERRTAAREAFLARLRAVDLEAVSAREAQSARILDFILKSDVAFAPFKPWRRPFLSDSGFHTTPTRLSSATPLRTADDYETFLTRLEKVPAYLDQNVENMRLGLADGFTQPKEIMPGVLSSFEALATGAPTAHPLYLPFADLPAGIAPRRASRLRKRAAALVENEILPAYARANAFMRDEYAPGAAESVAAGDLPDGAAYYETAARYYTSLDDADVDEIHELGLREVARIRAEMDEVIKDAGFEGSFEAFQDFLRTDPQFYAETAEDLLKEATFIVKDVDGKLPALFGKLPRQPYSVEPVPAEIAPNYTTGRYVPASLTADRGGQYWVNTYDLKERPLYQLPALSLHEAVPGHHLQSALSKEIENVPDFRQGFYPNAYGEGWGLYSEKLGLEMDVYKTPYEHFGRLSYEMWRACRLVIDTGLHAKGWSRQQAIDYLAGNTALARRNVRTEIDRYIAWPGQALAYKIGELTILELRRKAEKELGDGFDIRAFHDAVLVDGGVPLDMLRERIDDWIAERKG
ncbi:MAG: DUF885 family protein [Parvularculaceae bacterium]